MMGRSLGMFLYHFRRKLRLSQEELAQLTGISPVQLGKIERGEIQRPHQRTWSLIAEGLGVTVEELERSALRVEHLEALIAQECISLFRPNPEGRGVPLGGPTLERDTTVRIFGDF
jgi:transcriptional regulator with XRE-family HTH domain